MLVLSFDVGIINLSYCLLEYSNDEYKIIDWNIININTIDSSKCKCGSIGSYINNTSKECYCKKHIDYTNYINNQLNNIKCNNNCTSCIKKSKYNIENNYYCLNHAKEYIVKHNFTEIKNKKKDFNDIIYILICELNKRQNLLNATDVIIENQPAIKNPKMKSIASCLYNFYLIKGILDKNINNSNIEKIKFYSPSNRFKIFSQEDINILNASKKTSKYYKTIKQLAIKYCNNIIQNDSKWLEFFNTHTKKDDLADSLLQAFVYTK